MRRRKVDGERWIGLRGAQHRSSRGSSNLETRRDTTGHGYRQSIVIVNLHAVVFMETKISQSLTLRIEFDLG